MSYIEFTAEQLARVARADREQSAVLRYWLVVANLHPAASEPDQGHHLEKTPVVARDLSQPIARRCSAARLNHSHSGR
jgi:hypothetical protein